MSPEHVLDRLLARAGRRVILSGPSGMDSLLAAHLLLERGCAIECFYRCDCLGVPCLERPTDDWHAALKRQYPDQVGGLLKTWNRDAFRMISDGTLRWHEFGTLPQVARDVSREEVEDAARRATGLSWVVDGLRVDEMNVSYHAQTMRECGGIFVDKRKASPLWMLRRADVKRMLALRGVDADALPVVGGYRSHMGTSGWAMVDEQLAWLRDTCRCETPCLSRVLAIYPGAAFMLARQEHYGPEAYLTRHQPLLPFRL